MTGFVFTWEGLVPFLHLRRDPIQVVSEVRFDEGSPSVMV